MPGSSSFILSIATSEPLALPGLPWPVELRSHPRARYLRLRIDEARRLLRLTVPCRIARGAALEWARGQSSWVETQIARIEPPEPFAPGGSIPFEGASIRLEWRADAPRSPCLFEGVLSCGGPPDRFAARVEQWLRGQARAALAAETRAMSASAGLPDGPVSVGDAMSRWGSCSPVGAIRYNWRLILAPPELRRYVVAHEVAHRLHLNHGARFRALEAKLYDGDVAAARLALRRLGPRLKRVGRGH